VIGGSAGIGLETARRARAEGAQLILAARNPERLERASRELGTLSSAAFDATNFDQLKKFFDGLPAMYLLSDHGLTHRRYDAPFNPPCFGCVACR
jgi:NADP-dependent 3-hydroxy acid dehydrogenase YdfG